MRLFCFGAGYVGMRWLKRYASSIVKYGTTRTEEKGLNLSRSGINHLLFPSELEIDLKKISPTHILIATPPFEGRDPVLTSYAQAICQLSELQWVGVLSSTSVYGDHSGGWVTEESPCNPLTLMGKERLKVEQDWLNLFIERALPVHIFRLSGIYGPGGSVAQRIIEGKVSRISKPGHCFSRIHVDDIVQVLHQSILSPKPGEIYNLADDLPAESKDVIEHICHYLQFPLPPLVEVDSLKDKTAEFYRENKKVSNAKIKSILKINLHYPTYKEGLVEELLEIKNHLT